MIGITAYDVDIDYISESSASAIKCHSCDAYEINCGYFIFDGRSSRKEAAPE
jgi:hypothetical protein